MADTVCPTCSLPLDRLIWQDRTRDPSALAITTGDQRMVATCGNGHRWRVTRYVTNLAVGDRNLQVDEGVTDGQQSP